MCFSCVIFNGHTSWFFWEDFCVGLSRDCVLNGESGFFALEGNEWFGFLMGI